MSALRSVSRFISWAGLTAVGSVHLVWATGSSWPAASRKRLAESVVGNAKAMPEAAGTAVVGVGLVTAGALAGGALGEGRVVIGARRIVALGLLARVATGGGPALAAMGLPPAGKKFRELDAALYRPLCAALGLSTWIGSRGSARKEGDAR